MNGTGPPKAKRAPAKSALPKLQLLAAYHSPGWAQSGIVWNRWGREAARLLGLYWRTNDERHLAAFTVHVIGMRLYGGPRK